jgi:hypothetical protein
MTDISGDAALRYYEHDGTEPLPVVLDALGQSGRDFDRRSPSRPSAMLRPTLPMAVLRAV